MTPEDMPEVGLRVLSLKGDENSIRELSAAVLSNETIFPTSYPLNMLFSLDLMRT